MKKRVCVRFALLGLAASIAVATGVGTASARPNLGGTVKSGPYGPICTAYKNACGQNYDLKSKR